MQKRNFKFYFDYLKKDRIFLLSLMGISFFLYHLTSSVWPPFPGRDFATYLLYYLQYVSNDIVYHMLMVYRTPFTGFFWGPLFSLGIPSISYFVMGVFQVLLIPMFYIIGSLYGKTISRLFSIIMTLYLSGIIFMHEISSDSLFYFFLVLWITLLICFLDSFSIKKAIIIGFITFLLVLIRPSAQSLILIIALPVILYGFNIKRITPYAIFGVTLIILMNIYSFHNYIRFNNYAVSRGSNLFMPAYKAFLQDKIMNSENGEYSTILSESIEDNLLRKEPYLTYNITIDQFFTSANHRMYWDLAGLSDRSWGWEDNYTHIRMAAIESVQKHPFVFISSSMQNFKNILTQKYIPSPSARVSSLPLKIEKIEDEPLTEGELIPRSNTWWLATSPDNNTINIEDENNLILKYNQLVQNFPDKLPDDTHYNIFVQIASFFPTILLLIIFSTALFLDIKSMQSRFTLFFLFIGIINVAIPAMLLEPTIQYRLPFDFIFIFSGLNGIVILLTKTRQLIPNLNNG
jgi:hypothetical protein